ncbi:MAG: HAD-IA family hydrolase [Firmicutes bacterium]|nr:HAD-IA family hydrolase [Bacillota bacterium]
MTTEIKKIIGTIQSGRGEAGQFLSIDWVRDQCQSICGFSSFPGTLNLKISPEDADFIRRLACARGTRVIPPPESGFCEARILPLRIKEQEAALVFPMVNDYYDNTAEIIAPVQLKKYLGKNDGDDLTFELTVPEKLPLSKGIIFDLDGTLIDSIELYYSILCEGLQSFNLDIPDRGWILEVLGTGMGFWEVWETLTAGKADKIPDFVNKSRAVFDEIWERRYDKEVQLFPGVVELLTRLHKAGVKMGVVTSSFYVKKMDLFSRNGINYQEVFQSIITRRDTVKMKPHPEPILRCLEQLGIEKESCICVGDSPCDIAAGRNCGMPTIGLMSGTGTRQSLSKEGADLILDNVIQMEEFINIDNPC